MRHRMHLFFAPLIAILLGLMISSSYAKERIVTAGGSITEIIYALSAQDELVGVDMTSTYPEQVKQLPQINHWHQLNIEGILSLKPSLFITWQDSEPKQIFDQLRQAKVNVLQLQRVPNNLQLLLSNIKLIAKAIHREPQGEALIAKINHQVQSVQQQIAAQQSSPRVLFLFSMSGITQVSGKNTVADSIMTLAGGENVATHHFYKNYSNEALITANPDIIIVTSQSLQAMGGKENLAKIAGVTHTNAWKHNRIVDIDQALILGMGPRIGDAIEILYRGFYPDTNQ